MFVFFQGVKKDTPVFLISVNSSNQDTIDWI